MMRCTTLCEIRCGLFFFFSSRRRHTRFDCDWSSDVCSSDLEFDSEEAMNRAFASPERAAAREDFKRFMTYEGDRKSTRLNSSHSQISYAVFCLKKKKITRLKATSRYQIQHIVCHLNYPLKRA